jgi:hypothetical protein
MRDLTPVTRERHAGRKWPRFKDFGFASKMTTLPVADFEQVQAAIAMPLAFVEAGGGYSMVALLSVLRDRNMLVGPDGRWLGAHVPLVLRAYPFRMVEHPEAGKVVLCMDEAGGLLPEGSSTGEDFFDTEGNLSPVLKTMGEYLAQVEDSIRATDKAVAALAEAGVIAPWRISVKSEDDTERPFEGLYGIDEAALKALSDDAILKLHKASALPVAYAQIFSRGTVTIFEQLAKVQGQLAPMPLPESVQKMFAKGSDDTVRFN